MDRTRLLDSPARDSARSAHRSRRDELRVPGVAFVDVAHVIDRLPAAAEPEPGMRGVSALREPQEVGSDLAPLLCILPVGPGEAARVVDVSGPGVVRGERESITLDRVGDVLVMIVELLHVVEPRPDRLLGIGRVPDAETLRRRRHELEQARGPRPALAARIEMALLVDLRGYQAPVERVHSRVAPHHRVVGREGPGLAGVERVPALLLEGPVLLEVFAVEDIEVWLAPQIPEDGVDLALQSGVARPYRPSEVAIPGQGRADRQTVERGGMEPGDEAVRDGIEDLAPGNRRQDGVGLPVLRNGPDPDGLLSCLFKGSG